jgi:hypothetical protein
MHLFGEENLAQILQLFVSSKQLEATGFSQQTAIFVNAPTQKQVYMHAVAKSKIFN